MLRAFDDGRVFGSVTGSAAPWLLALHGWGRTHRDFVSVVDGLDAIAVDLPGSGHSPPPAEPWGGDEFAKALKPVLDQLAASVVVVGHSFGGQVAVHLAAAEPHRVRALVLTGTPLLRSRSRPSRGYRTIRSLRRMRLVPATTLERWRERHGSADYRSATGHMRDSLVRIVNERYDDVIARVACPVELVWSDDDPDVPLSVAEQAVSLFDDARLTVVRGAGHLTPVTAASSLREAVLRHMPS